MIVRFKMDAASRKLKLSEWCRFSMADKIQLAQQAYSTKTEIAAYRFSLQRWVTLRSGTEATELSVCDNLWCNTLKRPGTISAAAGNHGWYITLPQREKLTSQQRFVLLKLRRQGMKIPIFKKP